MLHIKRYIIGSLIFIAIIGAYFYYIHAESISISLFGVPTVLPFAIWMIAPALFLLLLTMLHLWYHGAKIYFQQKRVHKEHEEIVQKIMTKLNGDTFKGSFKDEDFDRLSKLLDRFSMLPLNDSQKSGVETIDALFEDVAKIEKGEYLEPKNFRFKQNSPYAQKNQLNRLKVDQKFLSESLKKGSESDELFCMAFDIALDEKIEKEIKANWSKLSSKSLTKAKMILDIFYTKDKKIFTLEELKEFILHFDFSPLDYIELAKKLKIAISPDELLRLFESLAGKKEGAEDAYIYVLFELEMIDDAGVRIQSATQKNAAKFEAYLLLKKEGRHIGLDTFF